MDEPFRELARRDAKAIRGGMALAAVALVVGFVSLFAGPIVGFVAVLVAGLVQLNVALRVARRTAPHGRAPSGARPRACSREFPFAMGAYALFGGVAAIIASLPAAALATIVVGMTLAGRRG